MDVQAHAVLKSFLDLSSRHAAKLAGDVKGSQATGKIHSLRTFEKYTDSVKLAGEWGREHAGIRHLRDMTPELAQAYLEDRAAQGIGQKQLDADRFAEREGVRYIVEGKGGLRREILVDRELAARLETHRLDSPQQVSDRGIFYEQHYDIGGGKSWSQSVSDAADRALGWSNGAHGLRHSYAQERMAELQDAGKIYNEAREIVSQELGHFRADVVETYLR